MDTQQRDKALKVQQAEMILLYTQLHKELKDKVSGLYAKLNKWDYVSLTQKRRLKAFENEIKSVIGTFNSKANKELSKTLIDEYKRVFKETKSILSKDKQKLVKIKAVKEIKQDLNTAWSGLSYADRVEKNNMLIAYKVKEQIVQSARKNESIVELSARLDNLEAKSEKMIELLTETEINRATYIAFRDVVTQAGIEKIEYHTSGSARTCVECASHEGQVFTVGDEIELPIHPHCGCYYTVVGDIEAIDGPDE